jgi:hypothetical protein
MDWNKIGKRLEAFKGFLRLTKFQKEIFRKTRKQREIVFVNHISIVEKFLQDKYTGMEEYLTKMEEALQKGLTMLYEKAEVEMVNGVLVLKRNGNGAIKAKMNQFVYDWTAKLKMNLLSEKTIKTLFQFVRTEAQRTLKDNKALIGLASSNWKDDKSDPDFFVDEGQFNSFVKGYLSNMKGVLFNEPRRIREKIMENFGTSVARNLAIKQVGTLNFNRNIFKLSTVTHARAAFKNVIFQNAQWQGFVFYKMVVPKQVENDLSAFGRTALLLYLIKTVAEWNKDSTPDNNTNAVSGLGLHHNSAEAYYPIMTDELDEEREISKEQRAKLKEKLNPENQ